MPDFEYEMYEAPDGRDGVEDGNGTWSGMVGELLYKRADIALAALSVMTERERVIDYTISYYESVGYTIMMKFHPKPTAFFAFLNVLRHYIWSCVLSAFFGSALFIWILDKWSGDSYQNNPEKYKDDDEKRIFTLKETVWFCIMAMTPQGGGATPKGLPAYIVSVSWWLFGFIFVASYTANLGAYLTILRMLKPPQSFRDLREQHQITLV